MNSLETEILELIKKRQHHKVDGLWVQLVEEPSSDPKFYQTLIRMLAKAKNKRRLNEFATLLIDSEMERGNFRRALVFARMFLKGLQDGCEFKDQILKCVRELNPRRERLEEYIERAGFDEEENVGRALQRLDKLIYNDVGEVFEHDTLGIGKVLDSDPDNDKVVIEFEGTELKEFTFQGTREFLRKIPQGHYHYLRMRDPERLRDLAFSRPIDFMKVVLRSFDREMKVDSLKKLLTQGFFSKRDWNKWWKDARDPLMHDPFVEYSGGSRGTFKLREAPRELTEELVERFHQSNDPSQRRDILKEAQRQFKEGSEKWQRFVDECEKMLVQEFRYEEEKGTPSHRLELAYLWEELHLNGEEALPGFDAMRELGDPQSAEKAVLEMNEFDYQTRALERFAQIHSENFAPFYAQILLNSPPRLAGWIMKRMEDNGYVAEMAAAAEKLLDNPLENIDTCIWGMKQYFSGKWDHFYHADFPQIHVRDLLDAMEKLFHLADQYPEQSSQLRGSVAKIRNFLWADHCKALQVAIRKLDADEAREMMDKVRSNPAVSDDYVAHANTAFRQVHHDIDKRRQPATQLDDNVMYVTEHTLRERRREYEHLNAVEIPKNSKEIGEAAALGDLKENAEYHAAKERQKLLFARVEELQQALSKAKVIDLENVRTDMITVGTSFEAKNLDTDEVETFTLLGLWDAKPEEHIYSYRSPLATPFMGKRVGDTVQLNMPGESARYKILNIAKAEVKT